MKKVILAFTLLVFSYTVYAEGYQVNAQSQKNLAMGHTGVGLLLGASAVHFNPGALGFLQGNFDFSLGGTLVYSDVTYSKQNSLYQSQTNSPIGTPFYFYAANRLSEKCVLSIGVTTPYGNSLSWDSDWDGRYLIQDITLHAIVAQPTISYKVNEKLGVGLGAMVAFGAVDLNRALPITGNDGESSVHLDGSTTALGFNAGIFYQINEALSLGVNYRSKIEMEMKSGNATFNVPEALSLSFPKNNKFNAKLPLPANLTVGVGFKVNDKLTLAADIQHVRWSAYDELNFDFEINTPQLSDSNNPRDYSNTFVYRVGAEYKVSKRVVLRGGGYYDETPISDDLLNPETPGMNKIGISTGASVLVTKRMSIDASLLYIKGFERDAGYAPAGFYGNYKSQALLPGIGISYSF